MSSVTPVPELAATAAGQLSAKDAWLTVRRYGTVALARESFSRFRYGDGFSHARAMGLQLAITAIPLVIATIGLASAARTESLGLVLRRTLLALTPGASDAVVRETISPFAEQRQSDLLALGLGLVVALVSLTTTMGQLERGANRIYGIRRDRPAVLKYRRAAAMVVGAGLPAVAGFVVLISAEAFAEAVQDLVEPDDELVALLARAVGTLLLLAAVTVMQRYAPDRHQPGWSLLALGGLVALLLWTGLTGALAAFLHFAADVGTVYGPLTGVMALLLWAQLTSAALLLGLAVSAQLEAAQVGRVEGAPAEVERPQPGAGEVARAQRASSDDAPLPDLVERR